jgi:hypothetical protein
MFEVYSILRVIHQIASALWLGEVLIINAIVIPVLSRYEGGLRRQVITSVFPRLFKLASILSLTVIVTGLFLLFYLTNGNLEALFYGRWGLSILIGGSLGILLTIFHFFIEDKLAKKIVLGNQGDEEKLAEVHLKMKIIPKIGLIILLSIFLLMINATHGIF